MKDLDAIYFAARELAIEGRPGYLAKACGGDSALRSRVEQMLAVADQAEAFITDLADTGLEERNPGGAVAKKLNLDPTGASDEFLGEKIGRYKILERLGEGGCGVVYVAEQTEPVRRRVALKVIKPGMDTRTVIARFEAERQALAMMDHPNIAKVLDAGATQAGRPYFVMELVRGTRITEYCDRSDLSTQARLDLFMKVCHAIQHAHQKGIIHRDIKPSNILVTLNDGVPVPKVIDFGIAKATEGRLTDATVYTQLHQFIGTPAYMSPEQAEMSGLDIDTRSDIYSLGVLLYELLVGSTPFDAKELAASGIDAMRKTIREKEPMRPSTRLATLKGAELPTAAQRRTSEAPKLIDLLKGDLDWIVMKCLEKDRTRRYETASDLASDLNRHLDNEPVVARPPSAAYRMQKALRRNKLAFITVFAVGMALLAGTAISTWQAVEATRARKDERKQRVAAQQAEAHASAQQKKAETEKQRAEVQLTRAEWLVYASKLREAQTDFEVGNGALALHYLSECQEKLRGWEWRYLSNRINAKLTLVGHLNAIQGVAFSPDGRRIATASHDKTAKVWDATTGAELLTLRGHRGDLYSVAFSPDGQRIVTGAGLAGSGIVPGEAKVWNATTGQQILDLQGHNYPVWSVAFSPDGRRIASAAAERVYGPSEVKLWDAATGQELLAMPRPENIRCLAFSPDSHRIVTGDFGNQIRVWDVATGEALLGFKGHSQLITSVAFSPDGQRIVSGSWDRTAKVWDASTGREMLSLKGHAGWVMSASFSPDGKRVATGSWDGTVKIWDAQTAQEILALKGHAGAVQDVAFSPDGKCIVSGSDDKTARLWDAERGQEIPTIAVHSEPVQCVAFRPDSKRFVTGSYDGTARVWDTETLREVSFLKSTPWPRGGVSCVAYSADGGRIVSGNQDKSATIWDAETGQKLLVLEHTNAVLSVAFSPDGNRLVAAAGWYGEPAHRPGETTVWNTETGQSVLTLQNSQPAWSVAYSPDGRRIVAGLWSGVAKVWDAATGQELFSLKGHKRSVAGVAFSRDGKRIVTGSYDQTAKVWDAETGQELLTLNGHTHQVRCVAFSPNGRRVITGGDDLSVKIWESDMGLEVFTIKGHVHWVSSVAFSPDGQRIATCGSHDNTAKIWYAPLTP